jgi:hypothetical protein
LSTASRSTLAVGEARRYVPGRQASVSAFGNLASTVPVAIRRTATLASRSLPHGTGWPKLPIRDAGR